MRVIMVAFWSVLISAAISYVLTSMAGEAFNLTTVLFVAGLFFISILVISEVGLKEETE